MTRRLVVFVGLVAAAGYLRAGPVPSHLTNIETGRPSVLVVDRNGERLYEARTSQGTRGEWIPPDALPPLVVAATMAAEDHRFLSHPGVDPVAIGRAFWRNVREWRVAEGGSTITQQVVALADARVAGDAARSGTSLSGKVRETILAVRLEQRLSKAEILSRYLTLAPYGNQIEGVSRAATYYFGLRASELSAAQAAYLAALPQQPSRFNPRRDPSRALPRQQRILRRMAEAGALDAAALDTALRERITITAGEPDAIAPHWVRRALALHEARSTDGRSEAVLRTSLDARLQRTMLGILRAQRPRLDRHDARQAAVVVFDNRSREWLAWVTAGSDIDAALTPRQPGSALKPFTYAAAFEQGWHPARVLADIPSSFPTAEPGILYSPRNYDGRFRGPLRARQALAGSENVPAVALASAIGAPVVADTLRRAGLSTLDRNAAHYGLGLTLGNAEVRLDELVTAYAAFASPDAARAGSPFSATTRFWITDILSDAEARRYVFGDGSSLDFPFTVAVKTGTSQAYHDNWTIGYTADVTVGVWVGNLDRTPLRNSSGVTGAGPLFHDVMLAAVEHTRGALPLFDHAPILAAPDTVAQVEICSLSGMAAGTACPARTREWLPHGDAGHACTWHHASDRGVVTVYPETYRLWSTEEMRQWGNEEVGKWRNEEMGSVFRIASPPSGATYLIDPTLRRDFQTLPLRATGAIGRIEWRVNGGVAGATLSDGRLAWPLTRGTHAVEARDAAGRVATSRIVVK